MPMLSDHPPVFTMHQARHSAWDPDANTDHWSTGVYFSDFQLPGAPARYGIYLATLAQAGPM